MAGEVLLTVSRDEVERLRLDSEFKYELDHQSHMVEARQEGFSKGLTKGLAEGLSRGKAEGLAEGLSKLTETARRMKRDGLAAGQIAAYTGLSPGEIERL